MSNKIRTNFGHPVFGQLLGLISRDTFYKDVKFLRTDRYVKHFTSWDHMVCMLYATIQKVEGLRELTSGLAAHNTALKHLGMKWLPRRSTLSDANARRSPKLFEMVFKALHTRYGRFLPDSLPQNEEWLSKLFIVDSTTITLFKNIMKACGASPANGRRKGGVKVHLGMWQTQRVGSLVRITSAATSDRLFMPKFKDMAPGTILVFDKAYVHYKLFNHWSDNQVHFVSRISKNAVVSLVGKKRVAHKDSQAGVLDDDHIELGHGTHPDKVPCRLIRFYDKEKNRVFRFITNNRELPPRQIAECYRQRWQIEILFKRLKQNLKLNAFLGDNENAIRIQIWCVLIADFLMMLLRKKLNTTKKIAFSNLCGLIRLHLMHYVKLSLLLTKPEDPSIFMAPVNPNPQLFEYHPP